MKKTFREWPVEQSFLFPPSVKDFVPEGHLSHFVRELVLNDLDLGEILSCYDESRGYPPYDPRMMTSLLLYGYTQGIYSSRKLSRACIERVDFMSVCAMNTPDFRTISSFRKRHLSALGGLFIQVLNLCRAANLVKLGHVSLDGSKVKANASMNRNKSYKRLREEEQQLKNEVQSWFDRAEAVDSEEDKLFGKDARGDELPAWVKDKAQRAKKLQKARESLETRDKQERETREQAVREGKKPPSKVKKRDKPADTLKYNFTDPDSVTLKRHGGGYIQGYNTQIAVDTQSYVIVSSDVCNAKNDLEQLIPTLNQIERNFGTQAEELSADAGYCSEENLRELQQRQIRGYVAIGSGPPGERKKRVVPGTLAHHMSLRLRKGGKRSRYHLRKITVEPVFGNIKAARGFQQFLLRGLESVKNEWLLVTTAHNIHKLAAART